MKSSEYNVPKSSLQSLGFNNWCKESYRITDENFSFARIIAVNRGNYQISNGDEESIAELSGKFLFSVESSLDYPTVGDWVCAQFFPGSVAIIHSLLPRKSVLKRLDPGKGVEFQLIASNIDTAFIVQSVNADFDVNRLERYLVMVTDSGITPIILLTKTDLISEEKLNNIRGAIKRYEEKYEILSISSISGEGLETLSELLDAGMTYSLLGSSGVGKTTLLNSLIGEELFHVREIRQKDDKGKHTTTKRQLVCLESGALFIDTPGMRELGNFDIAVGMEETFNRIHYFTSRCRFKNCTHTEEKGCALLEAVDNGDISDEQYGNYMKLQKEADFYEMSAYDKRQKDKKFKKACKQFQKRMRKK